MSAHSKTKHKKTLYQILTATSSLMFITVGVVIGKLIPASTPMSEILHDIFSVSPLLILVVAMYLLTIQITKDI